MCQQPERKYETHILTPPYMEKYIQNEKMKEEGKVAVV
jgi:hypothetical protein